MSRILALGRTASAVGVTLSVAAVGAAVGFAAERYVAGRSLDDDDPYKDEPLGGLRGAPYAVHTDDGVRLHVEVDDVADPDLTIVFTHGYALSLDSWHFQRRDLRGTARLVFWDQRSHGRSSRGPEGGVSFERLAADLAQVIEEVVPDGPIVLAGHSMGAMTVLALARRRPELFGDRVAGVGLIACSARDLSATTLGLPGPAGRLAHRLAPGVVASLARRPELVERGRRASSDLGYLLTRRYSFVGAGSPTLVAFTAQLNAETPIEVVAEFLPLFASNDQRAALPVLTGLPALVVAAEGDRLTPVEHGRELADALPGATYLEVPNAGHMVQLEYHELITEHLGQLVDQVREHRAAQRRRKGPRWWRRPGAA